MRRKDILIFFSEVEVVLILRRYNIVPEDLEEQIHQFFNSQRLNVEIYDKNHNAYRVILAESSRKFRHYDEYLLVHLSKYIQQMLEKYTVLQSDLSYTLNPG